MYKTLPWLQIVCVYSFFCGRQRNNDLVVRVLARGVGDLTAVLVLLFECRLQPVPVPDALISPRITGYSCLTGALVQKDLLQISPDNVQCL